MPALESVDVKFEQNGMSFHANLLKLENAILIFFYEGSKKLGTVAVAMPGVGEEKAGRSSVLVGAKCFTASRSLAERAAGVFGKMAIASFNTTIEEGEALRIYFKLFEDLRKSCSISQ